MNRKIIIGYLVGPVGLGLLGFISIPLMTWYFSIESIGRISMLQAFISFCILVFSLGLDQAYVREYHISKDKNRLLKSVVTPSLILSASACIFFYLFNIEFLSNLLYDIPSPILSFLTLLCFIFALLSRFLGLVVRMQERSLAYSMSQILPKLIFIILIVFTAKVNKTFDESLYLIFLFTISTAITFIIFLFNTRADVIRSAKAPVDYSSLKSYLLFGLPLILGSIASWGMNLMDRFFLKQFSNFTELGLYSVAVSIAGISSIFAGVFNTIWAPQVYKWMKEGRNCHSEVSIISEYLMAAISFVVIITGLISWITKYFLPVEYNAITYILSACILGPLLYTLSEVLGIGIAITKRTSFSMLASVSAAILNLILNFLLIPKLGAGGAASATVISFYLFLIMRSEFSKSIWLQHNTIKTYSVTLFLMILSILDALKIFEQQFMMGFWVMALILNLYIYIDVVNLAFKKSKVLLSK